MDDVAGDEGDDDDEGEEVSGSIEFADGAQPSALWTSRRLG